MTEFPIAISRQLHLLNEAWREEYADDNHALLNVIATVDGLVDALDDAVELLERLGAESGQGTILNAGREALNRAKGV